MKKIVIFEDSLESAWAYKQSARDHSVRLLIFSSPHLTAQDLQEITEFDPDLFVVDLVLGGSKMDGYQIIRLLHRSTFLREVPMVVVSKFINTSKPGQQESEDVLSLPGVVAALSKIPNMPSITTLLSYCQERTGK